MWIPPEDVDPVLLHAPTRKQTAVFGAVCPSDGRFLTMPAETFDAQTFQLFLGQLLRRRRRGRAMVVVVDNARWHHARAAALAGQAPRRVAPGFPAALQSRPQSRRTRLEVDTPALHAQCVLRVA